MDSAPRHQCLIYDGSPAKHLHDLAALVFTKLNENRRCLFLNTPAMVAGMRSYLSAAGLDVAAAVQKGSLILASDQSHLIDGSFDVDRMLEMLSSAVKQALTDGYQGLWATGDMSWELGNENNFSKLLEYERGLERLFPDASRVSRGLPIPDGCLTSGCVAGRTLHAPGYLHQPDAFAYKPALSFAGIPGLTMTEGE